MSGQVTPRRRSQQRSRSRPNKQQVTSQGRKGTGVGGEHARPELDGADVLPAADHLVRVLFRPVVTSHVTRITSQVTQVTGHTPHGTLCHDVVTLCVTLRRELVMSHVT
eukprot:1807871-Rhodomonas_salina.1